MTLGAAAALHASIAMIRAPRAAAGWSVGTLLLIVAAWWASHETALGWIALSVAVGVEVLRATAWRSPAAAGSDVQVGEPAPSPSAAPQPPVPVPDTPNAADVEETAPELDADEAPVHAPTNATVTRQAEPAPPTTEEKPTALAEPAAESIEYKTYVLLERPWDAAGEVFLASLRRGGRRDAVLDDGASDSTTFQTETGELRLVAHANRIDGAIIANAARQTWDWPAAAATAQQQTAYVDFITRTPPDARRADIVRLHEDAHAAFAEFTPVLAALWPGPGRLVAPDALRFDQDRGSTGIIERCLNFRTAPLPGDTTGRRISDCVGLHAFGLPDFEVLTDGEPDAATSDWLYHLAERCFVSGDHPVAGAHAHHGEQTWHVTIEASRCPPERRVVRLEAQPSEPAAATPPGESPS